MAGPEAYEKEDRLTGWALERQQLRYMLWRHGVAKRRAWGITLVEVISPVVIMFALVLAYHLVEIEVWPEHIYTDDAHILIHNGTADFVRHVERSGVLQCAGVAIHSLDLPSLGNIYPDVLEQEVRAWQDSMPRPTDSLATPLPPGLADLQRQAVEGLVDSLDSVLRSNTTRAALRDCVQRASSVLPTTLMRLFSYYNDIKGPLPVLTFDEFVLLSKSLQLATDKVPGAEAMLNSFKRDFGFNWLGNLVGLGGLAFVPNTPDVLRFTEYMSASHAYFDDVFMGVYEDATELERMATEGHNFWAVVQFEAGPSRKVGADYTIRMSFIDTPETYIAVDHFSHWTSQRYKTYITSGFLSLQLAINNFVLGNAPEMEAGLTVPQQGPKPAPMPGVALDGSGMGAWRPADPASRSAPQKYNLWMGVFPKGGVVYNKFYQAVGPMLGLLLCLSLIFPLAMLIRGIVEEKETKMREVLFIMGLRSWVLHASWLIAYLIVFALVSSLTVLVAGTTFLALTSKTLLLVYFMAFSVSELAFGIMMSTLFSRAKVAAIVGPLMHFAFIMPRYVFFRTGSPQAIGRKLAVSLLAPSAFTFGADLIATYESGGLGLQWRDIWSDAYPFGATILMMLLDSALYLGLAAYLDQVVPSGYGATQPPWFPFLPSWWRGSAKRQRRKAPADVQLSALSPAAAASHYTAVVSSDVDGSNGPSGLAPHITGAGLGSFDEHMDGNGCLNGAPSHQTDLVVSMDNLHMTYPNGVVAVHNLSMQMHLGEITSLLGHNGAGKSTTVAMMTGLTMPTSGDCTVDGHSIVHDTLAARRSLGICPQQNVLADILSVREHLVLLAALKGVPGRLCQSAAVAMLKTIGLPHDGATLAKNLSGGMKRKLQVGMALVGGSRLVVLDEPTSGMDPSARRALWSLMRAVKKPKLPALEALRASLLLPAPAPPTATCQDRALLLTTHYMDEADILSDKVAIMSAGRLCCSGSPLELKAKYGDGYTLTLSKLAAAGFGTAALEELVTGMVPHSALIRHAAAEIVFRLPLHASATFPGLFDALERRAAELGVAHYGIAMPTMEEVFLRATHEAQDEGSKGQPAPPAGQPKAPPAAGMPNDCQASPVPVSAASFHYNDVFSATAAGNGIGKHGGLTSASGTVHQLENGASGAPSGTSGIELGDLPHHALHICSAVEVAGQSEDQDGEADGGETPVLASICMPQHGARDGGNPAADKAWRLASGDTQTLGSDSGGCSMRGDAAAVGMRGASMRSGPGEAKQRVVDHLRHAWRCFRQMVWKRRIIASRDWKGMLYLFLLPVVAVAFTLLILTVNVDPTGPSLVLSLHSIEQYSPVPVGRNPAPGILTGCLGPAVPPKKYVPHNIFQGWRPHLKIGTEVTCPGGLALNDVGMYDSRGLSVWLLQQFYANAAPQYGAIMFDDPSVRAFVPYTLNTLSNATTRLEQQFKGHGADLSLVTTYLEVLSIIPGSLEAAGSYALKRLGPEELARLVQEVLGSGPGPASSSGGGRRRRSRALLGPGRTPAVEVHGGQRVWLPDGAVRDVPDIKAEPCPGAGTAGLRGGGRKPLGALSSLLSAAQQLLDNPIGDISAGGSDGSDACAKLIGAGCQNSHRRLQQATVPAQSSMALVAAAAAAAKQAQQSASLAAAAAAAVALLPNSSAAVSEILLAAAMARGAAQAAAAASQAAVAAAAAKNFPALQLAADTATAAAAMAAKAAAAATTALASAGRGGSGAGTDTDAVAALLARYAPVLAALLNKFDVTELLDMYKAEQKAVHVLRNLVERFRQPPVTIMWNGSSYHGMPAMVMDVHQALANLRVDDAGAPLTPQQAAASPAPSVVLRCTNHPLPLTSREHVTLDTFLTVLAALFVLVPFCYLSGAYAVSPVTEARCGAKAMQLGSSCPRAIYWLGSYAFDMLMHLCVTVVSLATFAAFQDAATTGDWASASGTFLLLLGYGAGVIPLSYCYSFGFDSPSTAQVSVSAMSFVLGFMLTVGSQVMANIPECQAFQRVAVHFARLLPPFNLGEGLINLSTYHLTRKVMGDATVAANANSETAPDLVPRDVLQALPDIPSSVMGWTVLGRNLLALYCEAAAYLLLTIAIDAWRNDVRWRNSLLAAGRAMLGPLPRWVVAAHAALAERWHLALAGARPLTVGSGVPMRTGGAILGGGSARSREGRTRWQQVNDPMLSANEEEEKSTSLAEEGRATLLGHIDGRDVGGCLGGRDSVAVFGGAEGEEVEHEDVAAERRRVALPATLRDAICIRNLRKVYSTRPPKTAVHDLCLGVPRGQRFGFLGANGAGKSTTLGILSGQSMATSGDAHIGGLSVVTQHSAAQRLVGYCPQVDPLLEHMTAREQLLLYSRLKGVPEPRVLPEVDDLIRRCGLPEHMTSRASGTLSGGNKRKVALAMSLVGRPAAVLLDEPSSGMDPGARRLMWDAILRVTRQMDDGAQGDEGDEEQAGAMLPAAYGTGSTNPRCPPALRRQGGRKDSDGGGGVALVLTTHYMEECEALCERVGIMHKGRLVCVGSPQQLKYQFGGSYLLEVHGPESASMQARLIAEVHSHFQGAQLEGNHFGHMKFQLPAAGLSLSRVFQVLEGVKAELAVAAYSVTQPSLEQVFLALVGHSLTEEGNVNVAAAQ